MKKGILVFLMLLLFSPVLVLADIFVKKKIHSDEVTVMGQTQPATDLIAHQWLTDNKMANLTEDQSFIIDLEKNVVYWINNKKKSYNETNSKKNLLDRKVKRLIWFIFF